MISVTPLTSTALDHGAYYFLSVHHRVPFDPFDRQDILLTWRLRPEDLESAAAQDSFAF